MQYIVVNFYYVKNQLFSMIHLEIYDIGHIFRLHWILICKLYNVINSAAKEC